MTMVSPSDLNYAGYSGTRYDRDILNAIPFHQELHERISRWIKKHLDEETACRILDLGVGSGITSQLFKQLLPQAVLDVVDFSPRMLASAKKRLGNRRVRYLLGDYATLKFQEKYEIVISVIGLHHQTDAGKRKQFRKIYRLLRPGGVFIFGDLVTYRNPRQAARNMARHYHHLVAHAVNSRALTDWAHHHMFLNNLAPVEDQVTWLREEGFGVKKEFLQMNTALLIAQK